MAKKLTIYTYDWVPQGPRGFVRDLRLRWAAEEAGFPYDVRTVTVPWVVFADVWSEGQWTGRMDG